MSSYGSDYSDYEEDYSDNFGSEASDYSDYDESEYGDFENDVLYVTSSEIVLKDAKRGIAFDNKGKLTAQSIESLTAVRDVLIDYPYRINVFPFTDFGPRSQKDAQTVKRWLVKNGIQSSRITTEKPNAAARSWITITAEDKAAPTVIHNGALPQKETSKTLQA
eukprot:comp18725_c0_seq1/m.34008 comp18725_c0_seq1/g.34008  ORF comp18725_c0_seq1/g.34008 comp18725_c0_seq1/m.34008 type:complete len:164 (-) comp18725_c0_seq1:55-546(-)